MALQSSTADMLAEECEICERIISLFDHTASAADSVDLGAARDVLRDDDCILHVIFIQEVFGDEALAEAGGDALVRAVRETAEACRYELVSDQKTTNAFHGFSLLQNGYNPSKVTGRFIDPYWMDMSAIKSWKESCERSHGAPCSGEQDATAESWPHWVIDCWEHCIVPGDIRKPYITLSYVWGGVQSLNTTVQSLESLRKPKALADPAVRSSIARTVQHAIAVTPILGERYLWVDSLCIVQDDSRSKYAEILKMATIFSHSSLTMVAQGYDASHNLYGMYGATPPRRFWQQTFKLAKGSILGKVDPKANNYLTLNSWSSRGWTCQEHLFSRRCIYFASDINATMHWACNHSEGREDLFADSRLQNRHSASTLLRSSFPDMHRFAAIIDNYNSRHLTYPEDVHDAFAGVLNKFTACFRGGFINGLPLILFDVAILWQPAVVVFRRRSKTLSFPVQPSWSWMGWQGALDQYSPWRAANRYMKQREGVLASDLLSTRQVLPLVEWSYQIDRSQRWIKVPQEWYAYQQAYCGRQDVEPPPGWTRVNNHEINQEGQTCLGLSPSCLYKHEREPQSEFWFPIPLVSDTDQSIVKVIELISCRTQRCRLRCFTDVDPIALPIQEPTGRQIGVLYPNEDTFFKNSRNENESKSDMFEFAAIARGETIVDIKQGPMDAFETWVDKSMKEGASPSTPMEYYYCFWIEWDGKAALRRGLAKITKQGWEAQQTEWINLVMK